jgi:hypothetical protein
VTIKNKAMAVPMKIAGNNTTSDAMPLAGMPTKLAELLEVAGCPVAHVSRATFFLSNFIYCLQLETSFDHALHLAVRWEYDVLRPNRMPTRKHTDYSKIAHTLHEKR